MTKQREPDQTRTAVAGRERQVVSVLIVALLATAACFRLMRLSSVPGISGDEGWWGVQALGWLSGRYETQTTSGNPTDLFYLIPLAFLHAIAPPSFLLLRALPALVNLLALPVGFWFVRRLYGNATAWLYTVALAILPTAIAHSRICQDPSQTVFWTGVVVYLCLLGLSERRRAWIYLGAAFLVFPVALWTHPTNVFIAPFLVLPLSAAVRPLLPASRRGRAVLVVTAALLAALGLSVGRSALGPLAGPYRHLDRPWLAMASARMTDGTQWLEFAANNVRLFNGVTIYHYFSGARPATVPHDAGFLILAGASFWGFLLTPASKRRALDHGLMFACASTWVLFFAFAGPQALRPHAERWGLCLLVPGTLVLARGLAAWIERKPGMRWLPISAVTLVAASVLASFYINYFREFATTGGRSHLTYVTAGTEPKQQALEHLLARSGSGRIAVVTQQWWLFWPIAYLATEHPHVAVRMGLPDDGQPAFQETVRSGRLFFVEFVGTPELTAATGWIRDRGLRAVRATVRDASGRDHLEILEVAPVR